MAPSNALSIVQSEISLLSTALKYDVRFSRGYQDELRMPIHKGFVQLKSILNSVSALDELEPLVYLNPFLEVIRSEEVTGPITGLALTSVDKFLSYGLLELPTGDFSDAPTSGPGSLSAVAMAAEAIAESGTQARFVGTDRGSDEVVLMKVLQLLRTLLLVPAGSLISDRVVREILQSCFRICFEPKLSELLRRTAELCLASIIQLFFSRLPNLLWAAQGRTNASVGSRISCNSTASPDRSSPVFSEQGVSETEQEQDVVATAAVDSIEPVSASTGDELVMRQDVNNPAQAPTVIKEASRVDTSEVPTVEAMTPQHQPSDPPKSQKLIQPYDLPTIHDLLHYLTSLLIPDYNSEAIISVSLGLVTIALETGAEAITNCPSLLRLVQGDLTKHLLLLLYSDRTWLFAATLRVCFLLFESMRRHLKLQLEVYLQRLAAISSPDNETTSYERRELALESINRLFLIPGFATELYVNYDCDPYCSNLFEDTTKLLAKNAYPVDRLKGTHLLALEALLTVLNKIGSRCAGVAVDQQPDELKSNETSQATREIPRVKRYLFGSTQQLSREQLNADKAKKKVLIFGSEQFNIKPKQGIAFLQQYGALRCPLDADEMAQFLHENPRLDKRTMGEYLSDRKNEQVLAAYVRQFNFTGIPINVALRHYLETFRLPGEAPLIERLMNHFASHWYHSNDAPFADVDAAFTLAYAILMLNTDQHNPNSKKQNMPMTVNAFKKNLSGINGGEDFDPKLLEEIFSDIHKREIVMPSEQSGLVRENYLWKFLLRRSSNAMFIHTETGDLDADLFDLVWGPTVSALSFIFDKTLDPSILSKVVHGFVRAAAIAAHHGLCDVLDNLVISLCKFTTLLTTENPDVLPISIGRNAKSRLALRLVFALVSTHADILRYGWHSLLDCLLQLFRASLLPGELTEAEDFLVQSHRVRLTVRGCVPIVERPRKKGARSGSVPREGSVLSSFYQYFTSASPWNDSEDDDDNETTSPKPLDADIAEGTETTVRRPMPRSTPPFEPHQHIQEQLRANSWVNALQSAQLDEQGASRLAFDTVQQCEIVQFLRDTKFLVDASLTELIKALLRAIRGDYCSAPSDLTVEPPELALHNHTDHRPTHGAPTQPTDSPSDEQNANGHLFPATTYTGSSYYPAFCSSEGTPREDCRIFCLELLIRILLHNRDRVYNLWPLVQYPLAELLLTATQPSPLFERVIVGFLRLAIYLLRRYEMAGHIFACLHYILLTRGDQLLFVTPEPNLSPVTARRGEHRHVISPSRSKQQQHQQTRGQANHDTQTTVGLQVIAGISQLLHDHAADLPDPATDWQLIFNLIEVCGAGLRAQQDLASQRSRHAHHSSFHNLSSACSKAEGAQWQPDSHSSTLGRGYTSDSEASNPTYRTQHSAPSDIEHPPAATAASIPVRSDHPDTAWVLVDQPIETGKGDDFQGEPAQPTECTRLPKPKCDSVPDDLPTSVRTMAPRNTDITCLVPSRLLALQVTIGLRDATTLKQAVGCLDFLIRDPAHITPDNFECCVRALRIFVEACLLTRARRSRKYATQSTVENSTNEKPSPKRSAVQHHQKRSRFINTDTDSDVEDVVHSGRRGSPSKRSVDLSISSTTGTVALQLLDLINLLFKRATSIYTEWTRTISPSADSTPVQEDQSTPDAEHMWTVCWRPLLQATARLCCDCRREVRTDALAHLQRDLLSPVLQSLSGQQWENCFDEVLFPLLSGFLESIALEEEQSLAKSGTRPSSTSQSPYHFNTVEFADPRMRAIPLLTKVFLMHLRPLHELTTFHHLWMRMLGYMEQYMQASSSDSLMDAVRESLKNVLLVMYTGTHDTPPILKRNAPEDSPEARLWNLTAKQLSTFLPALLDQLFPVAPTSSESEPPAVLASDGGLRESPSPEVAAEGHEPEQVCSSSNPDPPAAIPKTTSPVDSSQHPSAVHKKEVIPVIVQPVVQDI